MLGTTVDEFAIFDANAESVFHIVINIMWKTEVLLHLQAPLLKDTREYYVQLIGK
ncbi:hypothetical protein QE382_000897 [Sphingobacterium zeae]|uniref:Uncharacterized protein n=1 Tax=Sphingobacterium zeae TaxID=1776859 RepID=A0ABU0U1U0_9SPHI|nr:hypothetical protein [Sphingobacterium zeae]